MTCYCTWENQHEANATSVTNKIMKNSIFATKIVVFAPTVTRKVILPKTVVANDMATKKIVSTVKVGFAHGVKEVATQRKFFFKTQSKRKK